MSFNQITYYNIYIFLSIYLVVCLPISALSTCLRIIIIIMLCCLHGYPWPSLATFPYPSSPLACILGYIPYLHIAAVCMFLLVVLLLLGHMWGSIGVPHLWVVPAPPAVSCVPGSSNFDSFCDRRLVAV